MGILLLQRSPKEKKYHCPVCSKLLLRQYKDKNGYHTIEADNTILVGENFGIYGLEIKGSFKIECPICKTVSRN